MEQGLRIRRRLWAIDHCDAKERWRNLLEYLQPFAAHGVLEIGHSRDVTAWSPKAGNESRPNRIHYLHKYYRNSAGLVAQGRHNRCGGCKNHVGFEADYFFRVGAYAVGV